jgi:hypothetical protein
MPETEANIDRKPAEFCSLCGAYMCRRSPFSPTKSCSACGISGQPTIIAGSSDCVASEPERSVFTANEGQIVAWMAGGLQRFMVIRKRGGYSCQNPRIALPIGEPKMDADAEYSVIECELPKEFEGPSDLLWIGYASDAQAALGAAQR